SWTDRQRACPRVCARRRRCRPRASAFASCEGPTVLVPAPMPQWTSENRSAHPRAVPGGVAPCRAEDPGPLHPEVQVVLVRVADGAVALERGAGGAVRGVARERLGYGDVHRAFRVVGRDGVRGTVRDRPRELELEAGVGEMVLP